MDARQLREADDTSDANLSAFSAYDAEDLDYQGVASVFVAIPQTGPASIQGNERGWKIQAVSDAESFVSRLQEIGGSRHCLRLAVQNLWRTYRFNQHYIGYLGGTVTEKEFERIARRLMKEQNSDYTPEQIRVFSDAIFAALPDEKLTSQDLSVLLGAPDNQIESVLQKQKPSKRLS